MNPVAAERHRRKMLGRIGRVARQPQCAERDRRLRVERSMYACSPATRFAIMRQMRALRRLDDARLAALARRVDPYTPTRRPVRWRIEPKRSSGYRITCTLPWQAQLGQRIARDLVVAQLPLNDRMFDWRGRGVHRYVTALATAIERHGPYVRTLDIRDCHPSIDIEAVHRLDLVPPELVQACINPGSLKFVSVSDDNGLSIVRRAEPAGPVGLLQGGSASSALLAAILNPAMEALGPGVNCLACCDNFSVVGASPEAVNGAAEEVVRSITGRHAGRLEFRQDDHDARDGFEHMGFAIRMSDDGVEVDLPVHKLVRVLERVERRYGSSGLGLPGLPGLVDRELAPFPCLSPGARERISTLSLEAVHPGATLAN